MMVASHRRFGVKMPKYTVPMSGWASISVTVTTDETDPEKIVELAEMHGGASLCHQCAGHTNNSLDIGDEWEPHRDDEGKPEIYEEG
jgi:hypothetical protein